MSQTGRSRSDASAGRDVRRRRLALAVDIVALTVREGALRVLLIRRSSSHHAGEWALPGGFVGVEEPLDAAAERELLGDTGVHLDPTHLEQLRAYGAPDRDDRAGKRVVTVAYLAIQPDLPEPVAGEDASAARWEPVGNVLSGAQPLAFDHSVIVGDAVHRVREELEHTALATAFCPQEFTEAQLRAVYEAVWEIGRDDAERGLDAPNFHRSLATLYPPIVQRVPEKWAATGGRPAALYRSSDFVRERGPAARLERPLLRPRGGAVERRVY